LKKPLPPTSASRLRYLSLGYGLVFLAVLGAYLCTLDPSFLNDDSPETVTAGITLGIQHPPGYALDALLTRIAGFLPLGGVCFRVNFFTALLASLGVLLLAFAAARFLEFFSDKPFSPDPVFNRLVVLECAWGGSLLLAFSGTYWLNALDAKGGIYHLQAVLLLGVLACFLMHLSRSREPKSKALESRWFYLAVLLFSLGFANHWETSLLFIPSLFLFIVRPRPAEPLFSRGNSRPLLTAAVLVLIGLSPLLYLPLRAHLHPVLNLGAPDDWMDFKKFLLREYLRYREPGLVPCFVKVLQGSAPWNDFTGLFHRILDWQGAYLSTHFIQSLKWPALFLAVLGLFQKPSAAGKKALLFVLMPLGFLLLALLSAVWIPSIGMRWCLDNFLLPADWAAAFLAATGLFALVKASAMRPVLRRMAPPALGVLLAIVSMFLLPLPALRANFQRVDQEKQTVCYDYGLNLLKSAPNGSIFFAEGDEDYFPLYYFQNVEGLRADVKMIPSFVLFETWGVRQIQGLYPSLGLTASAKPFSGPFDRIEFSLAEIIGKNRESTPCAFSWIDGAFHRFYLAKNPGLVFLKSGVLLEMETSFTRQGLHLEASALRTRRSLDCPTNHHESLRGIRGVYRLLGVPND
jgi:hypothetical protein